MGSNPLLRAAADKPYAGSIPPREMARLARLRGLHDVARQWEDYADMLERNRPTDGKSRAAGDAA